MKQETVNLITCEGNHNALVLLGQVFIVIK